MSVSRAYVKGWHACMSGVDGRYVRIGGPRVQYAWNHGFLDAMEAEVGERPEPATAGY